MSVPARVAVQDAPPRVPVPSHPISIALLGHGTIGAAVARGAREWTTPQRPLRIAGALVRDPARPDRVDAGIDFVDDPRALFARRPDVVVEALGGLEPARTFVRAALERRIPVVTANKALIAQHGDELLRIAARNGTALRYEASVLAGVPFLGTFAARPYAARVAALAGIVNGTSNYVLTRMSDGRTSLAEAIADAQRLGYAEPDASDDVDGIDAAHKLAILTRHFRLGVVRVGDIERVGIGDVRTSDLAAAAAFGGTIKAVVFASRSAGLLHAFAGPAFLPRTHKLASVDDVENALLLDAAPGRVCLSGPGAGPDATATTILDDVIQATSGEQEATSALPAAATPESPSTGWFVRLAAPDLVRGDELAKLLGSYGVWPRNTIVRERTGWFLTYDCSRPRIERALSALAAAGIRGAAFRALTD